MIGLWKSMAELLVLKQQKANKSMFPGDVVVVMPDGWVWGKAERGADADSMWCIVCVPGVPVEAFREYLEPLKIDDRVVLFRKHHLDLQRLPLFPSYEDLQRCRMEKLINPLLT